MNSRKQEPVVKMVPKTWPPTSTVVTAETATGSTAVPMVATTTLQMARVCRPTVIDEAQRHIRAQLAGLHYELSLLCHCI